MKTGNSEFFKEKVLIKPVKNELKNKSVVIIVGFMRYKPFRLALLSQSSCIAKNFAASCVFISNLETMLMQLRLQ